MHGTGPILLMISSQLQGKRHHLAKSWNVRKSTKVIANYNFWVALLISGETSKITGKVSAHRSLRSGSEPQYIWFLSVKARSTKGRSPWGWSIEQHGFVCCACKGAFIKQIQQLYVLYLNILFVLTDIKILHSPVAILRMLLQSLALPPFCACLGAMT